MLNYDLLKLCGGHLSLVLNLNITVTFSYISFLSFNLTCADHEKTYKYTFSNILLISIYCTSESYLLCSCATLLCLNLTLYFHTI